MGPLVPDVIGNNFNFIVALFIGIAFGFVLEQAGFSTSKKLVGLFYGYDFTVLRVFFTAGITAMFGVIALDHFGLLDISLIYINPTFLWSALTGGLIMGLGFILGGFCPGTSICAAAIGKIDAMIFVLGSFLGVLFFAEGYPLFEGIYKSADWGNIKINDFLKISQSLFAFILIVCAIFIFWVVSFIEMKVNHKTKIEVKPVRRYILISIMAILLGFSALFLQDRKEIIINKINDITYINSFKPDMIDSDELAFRLIDNDINLQIFDIRTPQDYKNLNLPFSLNYATDDFFGKEAKKLFSLKHKRNIIVAENEFDERRIAILTRELGFPNIYILKGGLAEFKSSIINFDLSENSKKMINNDTYHFRSEAKNVIAQLIEKNKNKSGNDSKKQKKRALGGC
jgi:rhodanese-related sulfurtransferase